MSDGTTAKARRQPRFHPGVRGSVFAEPFPPALMAKLPRDAVRKHTAIVKKLEASATEFARLRRELVDAPAADHRRAAEAVATGKELPLPTDELLRSNDSAA